MLFSESDNHLQKIYVQHYPYELGVITSVPKHILWTCRIEEVLINLTFETNRPRLELITVIGLCDEAGFPLVYFLLLSATYGINNSAEKFLTAFLQSVKERLSQRNASIFTGKKSDESKQFETSIKYIQIFVSGTNASNQNKNR